MTIINFEWPETIDEQTVKFHERRIREKAHRLIQKGKLDLYEYALYIEKEMTLEELIEVVEKQIRQERMNDLCEYRLRTCNGLE